MTKKKLVNYLKIDIYESNNREIHKWLKVLQKTINKIEKKHSKKINLSEINLDDKDTYNLIKNGDTDNLYGINYLGSKKNLRKVKPNNFIEFRDAVFVYRPSPLEFGLYDAYINNKKNKENITYISSDLKDPLSRILETSYGIILYHEQIMEIFELVK